MAIVIVPTIVAIVFEVVRDIIAAKKRKEKKQELRLELHIDKKELILLSRLNRPGENQFDVNEEKEIFHLADVVITK